MTDRITTEQEIRMHHISELSYESALLLETVTLRDTSAECWIECIDDNGEQVRLIPDKTGWQDRRKEVMVMNTVSGVNTKLFFTPGEFPQLHDITLNDSAAYQVMSSIPAAVLRWAILRAK